MSIDRYLAIRKPMIFRYICSHRNIILVIVGIWLTSMAFFITTYRAVRLHSIKEFINMTDVDSIEIQNFSHNSSSPMPPDFNFCLSDYKSLGIQRDVFGTVFFLFFMVIPCLIVLLTYSMVGFTLWFKKPPSDCDNRKSISSLQVSRLRQDRKRVALILLILAILFALCWMPYNIIVYLVDIDVIKPTKSRNLTLKYFLFLGYANSTLNPVIYCWMARGVRQNLARILHCIWIQ
ncbi:PREDICTED: pyroglutamylated RFamide peptide receptor-like [Wasmannia auropunctata]|uniref:pyroglutamylated RFamide peptide receptor-like n=1 Tax=Wasmannia auropunctata TaxID=64793 RepID=UPI0005EFCA69|nr:PREDICTED: pyroglutamylated RFamide peptide receptor-like [Wasmannia auropunctata]